VPSRSPAASRLALIRHTGSGRSSLDVAAAHALLERVATGEEPSTLRLYRPGPTVAFGRLDALAPAFMDAARTARAHGFEPVLRAPGGHAAAYHAASVVLDLAVADDDPVTGVQDRFADFAKLLGEALRSVGVDARVGEVPGEYCPGRYSVNARGAVKLAGIGQRIVAGGSHTGVVLVVSGEERINDVLRPVYEALGVPWEPQVTGSVATESPEAGWDAVRDALLAEYALDYELAEGELDEATLALARELAPEHLARRVWPPAPRSS
jgi:octanoyl-[GcvH]:protein N-octanoyltransferase